MELFGYDVVYIAGLALLSLLAAGLLLALLGTAAVLLFRRTRKILIPRATHIVLSLFEAPIKHLIWPFGVDADVIDQMLITIRNNLYGAAYADVPYAKRAVFLPQCLRDPRCPAPLSAEGIQCVGCGRCGIAAVKKEAEDLGYLFFIAPGSTLIKRMVKKYRPEAVLGVGCFMEVKEGTEMMASVGLPVQAIPLLRDGCVDTRVNVGELIKALRKRAGQPPLSEEQIVDFRKYCRGIDALWEAGEAKPSVTVVAKK